MITRSDCSGDLCTPTCPPTDDQVTSPSPTFISNQPTLVAYLLFYLREANFISFAINPPFIRIQPGSSMAVVATFGAIGTILKIVGWLGRELRSTVCRKGLILLLFQTRSTVSRQSFVIFTKMATKGLKKIKCCLKIQNFAITCFYNIREVPKPQSSIGSTSNFCDRPNKTNQRVLNQIDVFQGTQEYLLSKYNSGAPSHGTALIGATKLTENGELVS